MSGQAYAILAYAVALGLMWGYAAAVWLGHRRLDRRTARGRSRA